MMIISRKEFHNSNLKINGGTIERVRKFKYLVATLNEEWDCDEEVKTRIGIAKTTYMKIKHILLQRTLLVDLRLQIIKCYGPFCCTGWKHGRLRSER